MIRRRNMAAFVSTITQTRVLLRFCRNYVQSLTGPASVVQRNYSNTQENVESYDIIIVGGGLVGTTLACALASNGYLRNRRILLLEGSKRLDYEQQDKYSNRVVALNQHSCNLLTRIGAWRHIEATRFCPVERMQIWDANSDAVISFDNDSKHPTLAYIVENDLIIHAVNSQLQGKENVNVVYNSKVERVSLSRTKIEKAEVTLADGQKYRAQLVVGADGVNSLVRKAMNVSCVKRDYQEMGIVATLKLSEVQSLRDQVPFTKATVLNRLQDFPLQETENTTAWQRFLPTGPIALLPLTNCLSSLVWTLPTKEAQVLLKVSDEEFVDSVNSALWRAYPKSNVVEYSTRIAETVRQFFALPSGDLKQLPPSISAIEEGSRAAFPLGLGVSITTCATGAVLVGDAVHKVHPLAGQGANLGFGDVSTLVDKLAKSAKYGTNLGDVSNLIHYERSRLMDTIPITLGIHVLHDLYGKTWTPFVVARNLGVQFVNACQPLKVAELEGFFAERAAGETSSRQRS